MHDVAADHAQEIVEIFTTKPIMADEDVLSHLPDLCKHTIAIPVSIWTAHNHIFLEFCRQKRSQYAAFSTRMLISGVEERKSVAEGRSVAVRVVIGGCCIGKKHKQSEHNG